MAKKSKSKSCYQDIAYQLKTSPYTSSPVAVYIGSQEKKYHVSHELLQKPEWIASGNLWGAGSIHLPDVNEDSGHVLVHYLYTGTYQTLDDLEASSDGKNTNEFKRAVHVYTMAKTYELDGLQLLARQSIEHFGAEMDIFDIIEAIKEDFSKLPGDATWFHDYLDTKVETAFLEDHTTFARDDFFRRIDDVALTRVLAKRIVELYNNEILHMTTKSGPVLGVSEEGISAAQNSPMEDARTESDFAATREEPESIEPPSNSALLSEDSWDTFIEKKRGKKSKSNFTEELPLPPELELEFVPQDYGNFNDEPLTLVSESEPMPELVTFEPAPYVDPFADLTKSQRRKLEKRMKNEKALERQLEEEAMEAMEREIEEAEASEAYRLELEEVEAAEAEAAAAAEHSAEPNTAEIEMCPVRAKHLLEGDGWKTCKQCRAVLRQVAIQIAHAGVKDDDQYEMVDQGLMK